jgi:hypothetical protein
LVQPSAFDVCSDEMKYYRGGSESTPDAMYSSTRGSSEGEVEGLHVMRTTASSSPRRGSDDVERGKCSEALTLPKRPRPTAVVICLSRFLSTSKNGSIDAITVGDEETNQ